MKRTNKLFIKLALLMLIPLGIISCKKDSYLKDGGLENANTPLSTYDYLKNNQYHQFDTVLMLADHFKLKDSINNAKTFFAFTDMSLRLLLVSMKDTSLAQLEDSVTQNLFRQYMFRQTINMSQATLIEVPYGNYTSAKSAIKITAANQVVYLNGSGVAFPYNTLDYVKVNGAVDGSAGISPTDSVDIVLPCQTTGIKTSTGTTLHVLVNSATLNKQ
jgi:hypothetical protein